MFDHFEDRFASAFQRARKNIHIPSEKIMTDVARAVDYKEEIVKLKNEFNEKFKKIEKSGSYEGLKSFKFMAILGQGAFGVVKLVKHQKNDKFYAMKIISKDKVVRSKQITHALNEKKILMSINFPFVVNMDFSYKDNSFLYFCLPFINGGEMFTHLRKVRKFDEKLAKFYAAQVVMGFEYLHKLSLIYRDLKPENIMIDHKGFIKITDFGFCKPIKERTYTLCGTPEYLSPEVIQNKGYGFTADWWSFGILVFEMNCGYSPFSVGHPDQMQLLERICKGKYKMPANFSKDLKNLIENILQTDLTRRYGNLKNGVEDIKQHSWFHDINWTQVYQQDLKAPFVPKVSGPGDYSQFDDYDDIKLEIAPTCQYEKEFADF